MGKSPNNETQTIMETLTFAGNSSTVHSSKGPASKAAPHCQAPILPSLGTAVSVARKLSLAVTQFNLGQGQAKDRGQGLWQLDCRFQLSLIQTSQVTWESAHTMTMLLGRVTEMPSGYWGLLREATTVAGFTQRS